MMQTIVMLLLTVSLCGATVVTEGFLDAVKEVESLGGTAMSGDKGKASGWYHFHRAAWADVNSIRAKQKLKQYSYSYSRHEYISRVYAKTYFLWLERRVNKEIGPKYKCSPHGLYLTWCYGYQRFKAMGFRRSRASAPANARAEGVENLAREFDKVRSQ